MLPICFGQGTRMSAFLLDADKRYQATFRLGERTRTGDAEGEVVESRPVPAFSSEQIEQVFDQFRGPISQIPPMHSAIKYQGKPLYTLAHKGIEVERQAREVIIHSLELLSLNGSDMEVAVHCSKGTYVRTLAEDIGEQLGVGAHVSALRRLSVGPFDESRTMYTVEQLAETAEQGYSGLDALLLPLDSAIADRPAVNLGADSAFYVRQGQPVMVPRAPTEGLVRIYAGESDFIGVGEVLDDGRIGPRRLLIG
jgi:tRNA pseudouridine55 synthase